MYTVHVDCVELRQAGLIDHVLCGVPCHQSQDFSFLYAGFNLSRNLGKRGCIRQSTAKAGYRPVLSS